MIFVGDISLPYEKAVQLNNIPIHLENKKWFGNLEGSLIDNTGNSKDNPCVFNDRKAIQELIKDLDFVGFATANNHIFDTGSINETIAYLAEIGIPYCGIGKNLENAARPLLLSDQGQDILILNFGWEVIQCMVSKGDKQGVNPLTKKHVLNVLKQNRMIYPNAKIILFMHWSYELEDTPQPRERQFARFLIDCGADGIIGCHPHRIGGFELYNGKPIVYSLGNWMFKQNYYFNGKLAFPVFCDQELAFEWNFKTNELLFHFFTYNKEKSEVSYTKSEGIDSLTMLNYTPFKHLNNKDYEKWYRTNHYHRGKGLPIYYWGDSNALIVIKNFINKLRDRILKIILKLRK